MESIFGYKTEVVMRIAIAKLLVFAYNLDYLLRLTKLKYTHIFIVDFHCSRIYQMKEKKHVFHRDVLLLWNVFAVLNLKNLRTKDLTVRWLNNPLRGTEPLLIKKI